MFETTMDKDLELATSDAELESVCQQIFDKLRNECLAFIEELKQADIATELLSSSTPEETQSIWEKFSSQNQDLFSRIKDWATKRNEYLSSYEHMPVFTEDEEPNCIPEFGLMKLIVKDEHLFSSEDFMKDGEIFDLKLCELLLDSPNPLLTAAASYLLASNMDTMTKENIWDFYPQT